MEPSEYFTDGAWVDVLIVLTRGQQRNNPSAITAPATPRATKRLVRRLPSGVGGAVGAAVSVIRQVSQRESTSLARVSAAGQGSLAARPGGRMADRGDTWRGEKAYINTIFHLEWCE
ncbi:hypothetical protein Acsp02_55750 [Actinoplanes sp. NBRC 103695]|nr:hypothetical protein Acsp02_55750 [Actinoplanes sp. NBRC 103695]